MLLLNSYVLYFDAAGTFLKIMGDSSCFYIDSETGWIHVKANLKRSPCTSNSYFFFVIAEDSSNPPRQSNRVGITMEIRRFSDPTITNLPANVTIGECVCLKK